MVYSHWLSPAPGPGRMGCMVLRTFHIAPEQGQGPVQGQGRMGYVPIFQVLKLLQVVCFNDISMVSGVQSWPQTQPVRLHHYGLFTLAETDSETSSVNTPNGTGSGTRTGTRNISLLYVMLSLYTAKYVGT